MGFSRKLKYFLVHIHKISNKDAQAHIDSGGIRINGHHVMENVHISQTDLIELNGVVLQRPRKFNYLKFYKPRGYQSSCNPSVPDNLSGFFAGLPALSIAGRLDKDSEGLLLLSDDGKWVETICHPGNNKEKEYLVQLEHEMEATFQANFSKGVDIGNYITRPCVCERIDRRTIRVILKEGKNRQIRRMCAKLGNRVNSLKRVRIADQHLGDMKPGEVMRLPEKPPENR